MKIQLDETKNSISAKTDTFTSSFTTDLSTTRDQISATNLKLIRLDEQIEAIDEKVQTGLLTRNDTEVQTQIESLKKQIEDCTTSMNDIQALISSKKKDYWSPYTVQIQNDGPEKDFMNGVSKSQVNTDDLESPEIIGSGDKTEVSDNYDLYGFPD